MKKVLVLLFVVCISSSGVAGVTNLRCEYLQDPLGIDVPKPRLSWDMQSAVRGEVQTSAQIIVASSKANIDANIGDVWNTTISSGQSIQVEYNGPALISETHYWWKVKVTGTQSTYNWSAPASWSMGLLSATDWAGAKWIGADAADYATPSPLLRKPFTLSKPIKRAMVYVTAQGTYELHLNGQKVGDQILAPGWTEYRKRIQYQTFDVTAQLDASGENTIGAMLADGWYNAKLFSWPSRAAYGNNGRKLLLKLVVEHTDGTKTTVISDETWKLWADGYVRSADIYKGEADDLRKLYQPPTVDLRNWDKPGFSDNAWAAPKIYAATAAALVAQMSEPIRVEMEITPVKLTVPSAGVYIFDMGQNMVGWCRLKLKGTAGQTVTLRHGEMLNTNGTLYTANLRGADQRAAFTLNGIDSVYESHFTYHGFRYVEVTGLTTPPAISLITGRVFHSDAPTAGSFKCSNALLNKIWTNTLWGQRGNHMSVPTDCPQRDERMGWMGDAQIFAQTAIFNWGMAPFYAKWMQDIRDAQHTDGSVPDFVPIVGTGWCNAPAWGDAAAIVPWRLYLNYNDIRLIKDHYVAVKKWVDLIHASNANHLWTNNRGNNYSDWLDGSAINVTGYPTGGAVPKEVFATAFFYNSALLCAKMAAVAGQTADVQTYNALAADIRTAFNTAYVNTATAVVNGNSQAGYALALNFDMLPDNLRAKAALNMNNVIVNTYGNRISTGFNTTLRLMMELTRWGYNETAYKLAESVLMPSWGYSISQGATTIWERWDGWVAGRGFQDAGMNSFNHYSFGSVCEWFYRVVLGINNDDAQPGYRHFFIKPQPGGTLASAEGGYKSVSGEILSKWTLQTNGVFTLDITVPGNTTADISIPKRNYTSNWVVHEQQGYCWQNGAYQSGVAGITAGTGDSSFVTFKVGSGVYRFQAGSKDLVGVVKAPGAAVALTRVSHDPLHGATIISYTVSGNAGHVSLRIFNMRGALVADLVNADRRPGVYTCVWQGRGRNGVPVTSGVCFLRMQTGERQSAVKKLIVAGR